jgi:hypothetical protein
MKIGITGTRDGMTEAQRYNFAFRIKELDFKEFHHGSCKGVDVQAARIVAETNACKQGNAEIVCHPGPDGDSCQEDSGVDTIIHDPKTHFARNRDIVNAVDLLIVIPKQDAWCLRGGTWYTHDFAKKQRKQTWVIWPDGLVEESDNQYEA